LKTILVIGVIVGHATIAWTGLASWVLEEPHIREPLLSMASGLMVGSLFAMAVFFLLAGMFAVPSLARKGARRFIVDRVLRLGIPMLFFIVALSPVVEYVDTDNVGWDRGFWAFTLEIWWPPAPGPTWFLGVLLVFSTVYALIRAVWPNRAVGVSPLRVWHLATAAVVATGATFAVRMAVPLGEEVWHLAIGQAPGWVVGFVLGVVGAERGWFAPISPRAAMFTRRVAWTATVTAVVVLAWASMGPDLDRFGGGGTWESLLAAAIEGVLVVAMPIWLVDVFRRRFDHQSRLAQRMSRAAFAAFVVHQVILVGLILASRFVGWAPEIEYGLVSLLGVAASFFLGSLLVRIPGLARYV
jgi:surface polysaccharide O-acyltransferase-like enzyme